MKPVVFKNLCDASYIHFILIHAMVLVNIVSQSGEQTKRVFTGPRFIISPACVDSSKSTEIKSWNEKNLNYLHHFLKLYSNLSVSTT
jgi:hypothetical protein